MACAERSGTSHPDADEKQTVSWSFSLYIILARQTVWARVPVASKTQSVSSRPLEFTPQTLRSQPQSNKCPTNCEPESFLTLKALFEPSAWKPEHVGCPVSESEPEPHRRVFQGLGYCRALRFFMGCRIWTFFVLSVSTNPISVECTLCGFYSPMQHPCS